MIIEATHIHKSFGSLEVLKGIDLTVAPREIISIVGASGAGTTTLLQILGTLEAPAEGASLKICGEEVTRLSARRQAELRNRQIGFIFQAHQLLPEFTALENVMLPALIAGESRSKVRERALGLLERLGEQRLAEGGVVGGAVGDILQSWVHVAILPRPDPVAKGDNSPSSWGVTGSGP